MKIQCGRCDEIMLPIHTEYPENITWYQCLGCGNEIHIAFYNPTFVEIKERGGIMTEDAVTRQDVTIEDLTTQYHNLRVGEVVELTVKTFQKVDNVGEKFALSGETFRYEIRDIDNKVLSVNSWKLFGELRTAFKNAGKIAGTKLKIQHTGTGTYVVEVV